MAIAGSWRTGAVTNLEYAGATRWGTGINPIHAVRAEGPGRGGTKEPLGSVGPSDAVDPTLTDPSLYGFEGEDGQFYIGEDYRYMDDDHPNWGSDSAGRPDRGPAIMDYGVQPSPTGFPSWGPHYDDNPVDGFPLPGPSGGAQLRANSEGTDIEALHAIAVPTQGLTGGWLNKAHGEVARPVSQDVGDPTTQWAINTGAVQGQGLKSLDNTRAVARGTDDDRSGIQSRMIGMRYREYAKSSGMGGGPGTPDMAPVTQNLPYRPWYFRSAGLPPPPDTTYGTMTSFEPIQRVPPLDAGELVTSNETSVPLSQEDFTDTDYYA